MYIFSTPFFWLLSPIFRRMRYTTMADFFEERFSKSLGVGYSFFALYLFMLWQGTIIKGAAFWTRRNSCSYTSKTIAA